MSALSPLEAWLSIEKALPAGSRLWVYLSSGVGHLALISGSETLSERDWQALAEAHFEDGKKVALDLNWRSGKRAAIAIDETLLQAVRESAHAVLAVTSATALAVFRTGPENPGLVCVQDDDGWTVMLVAERRCNALAHYPAGASQTQIEKEAARMAIASQLPLTTNYMMHSASLPLNISRERPLFAFDLLEHSKLPKALAAVAFGAFLAVVIAATQEWNAIRSEREAMRFKEQSLTQLRDAVEAKSSVEHHEPHSEDPVERRMNWVQTFGELEALARPAEGAEAVSFSARAEDGSARLVVEIEAGAVENFSRAVSEQAGGNWHLTSIHKVHVATAAAPKYQMVLSKGATEGN